MHFSGDINRPPYEAGDIFLQISSGCSHGKCLFCTFYKDLRFHVSNLEEIENDIKELIPYSRQSNRIFCRKPIHLL